MSMTIKEVLNELQDYATKAKQNRRLCIDNEHEAYFEGKAEAYEAAITLIKALALSKRESLAEFKERLVWKEREVWWLTRKIGLLESEIKEEEVAT